MIQIAIISDVHANLPALEAVLADIEARKIEQVYCLGDLVDFAPYGNEVISLFRNRKIPCLLGNHDERIAFDLPVFPLSHHDAVETGSRFEAIAQSKHTITTENKAWLAQLPFQLEIVFRIGEKAKRILLVHASPWSNDTYVYERDPKADILAFLRQREAAMLVMGHTHVSYIQSFQETVLVNCGSVGRSKEPDRKACYAILEITEAGIRPEIIKLSYDVGTLVNAIRKSPIPDFYADFFLDN